VTRHQKRLSVPKSWPVERKTETFTVKADAGPHGEAGVPLLVLLRDVLGYVDSRKEARYALGQNSVLVNGQPVSDEGRPIGMFDIVAFVEREEYYRVFPDQGGRLALTPIDADAADSKLGKVVGKRQVSGGAFQLTMHDGQTIQVEEGEYAPNDSLVLDNETSEVVAHFPYDEGALVTAVDGAHAGEIGELEEIQITPGSSPNNVRIEQPEGWFETVEGYVVVIDENFVGDETVPVSEAEADAGDETDTEADVESVDGDVVGDDSEESDASEEDVDVGEIEAEADADDADADDADEEEVTEE
jgi:small subunit ribosomal protein S4e